MTMDTPERPAALAFESFVELQQANLALLEEKADPAKVREFIGQAVVTGAILQRSAERKAAQAAIDYWTTSLILSREHPYTSSQAQAKEAKADPTTPPTVAVLAEFDPGKASEVLSDVSPYRGLAPFTRSDAGDFFGREDAANELAKRLEGDDPVIVLLGPPGSGKSSLINAGLLPRLEERNHQVVLVGAPGREPLAAILRAIKPAADMPTIRADERAITRTPQKLNEVLTAVHPKAILVLDQFGEAMARAEVQPSLDIVGQALASLAGTHKVLISIRESQRQQFEKIAGIGPTLRSASSWFSLPPPTVFELRGIIEGPAERVGLRFADGVVEDLVRSVTGNPDAVPLLQFTLSKLWERRDHNEVTQAVYMNVGSPQNALTGTAEAVLQQFSVSEREVVRRIFLKLVAPSGEKDFVRNRLGRDVLSVGEDTDIVNRILDAFEREQLLRRLPSTDIGGEDRFEVAYETLIAYWPTLSSWLADDRQGREKESQLIVTARLWLDSGRDSGYLITGDALDKLRDYRSDSPDVQQLLDASFKAKADREAARLRAQKRTRNIGFAIAGSAVALIVLLVWAYKHTQDVAEKQQRLVEAREAAKTQEELRKQLEITTARLQTLQKIVDQGKSVDLKASLTSALSDSLAQTATPPKTLPQAPGPDKGAVGAPPLVQVQPQFDPKTGDCYGFMWVGSKTSWKLKTPDSPDKLKANGLAVANTSIYLRSDFPTDVPEYAMAVPLGFVPDGATVIILQWKTYQRDSGLQYWAKVEAPRKSCAKVTIQYAGPDDIANQLRKTLTDDNFPMAYAPEKLAGATGLSEVRFFFKEDTALAAAIAARVKEVNGGKPVNLRLVAGFVGSKPLVPGSLEVWVDLPGPAGTPTPAPAPMPAPTGGSK